MVHFLNQPFDKKHTKKDHQTQLSSINEAVNDYETEGNQDFKMTPLNAKAIAFIALTRRIKVESMPLNRIHMRDATLPLKKMAFDSFIGDVLFNGEKLFLNWSSGFPHPISGVGLSIGPKQLNLI